MTAQCSGDCPSVLALIGNCAASVLTYDCSCNSTSCLQSRISYHSSELREKYGGGLPSALSVCRSHYANPLAVVWAAVILNIGCWLAEMCCRTQGRFLRTIRRCWRRCRRVHWCAWLSRCHRSDDAQTARANLLGNSRKAPDSTTKASHATVATP